MGLAWSSAAALSIAPLQDLLNLGREARMNVPGRADGNWAWRCGEDRMRDPAFESLRDLTERSNRFPRTGEASSPSQLGTARLGLRTPAAVL
jgi:4-alpha-glucanotransferase